MSLGSAKPPKCPDGNDATYQTGRGWMCGSITFDEARKNMTVSPTGKQSELSTEPEAYFTEPTVAPISGLGTIDRQLFMTEDHIVFSPATSRRLSAENIALIVLMAKVGKTPEGQKMLRDIIIKYLDSCARIVASVQDSCHGNWLTALNNQYITCGVAHRIGLIDDGAYLKILSHYDDVFTRMLDKAYITDTVGSLTTLVTGSSAGAGQTGTASSGLGTILGILAGMKK